MRQVVTADNLAITGEAFWQRVTANVPLTIIGDLFMEDLSIGTEFLIEDEHTAVGNESFAGVALRVTASGWPFRGGNDSPMIPGLFLRVFASGRWQLCAEANCTRACVDPPCKPGLQGDTAAGGSTSPIDFVIKSGQIPGASPATMLNRWHNLSLSVLGATATASFDGSPLFEAVDVLGQRGLPPSDHNARAGAGW